MNISHAFCGTNYLDYIFSEEIDLIAVYAATLSTIIFIWNIIKDFNDKGKLKIRFYIGNLITPTTGEVSKEFLIWSIVNTGRKPIIVTNIGGKGKVKNFIFTGINLPKKLEPGESINGYFDNYSQILKEAISLGVYDSLDKYYSISKKEFKKLKKK